MEKETLSEMLIRHEGLRLKPYLCAAGKLTIGVGRNLDDNGISKSEAMDMLTNDIVNARTLLSVYKWWHGLSPVRQNALISMVFNLGVKGFKGFKAMLNRVQNNDFDGAADEMLKSKWAVQVGSRAIELAKMMREG